MVQSYVAKPILLISNKFNLPRDISEHIYHYILNISAQRIINNWYNHIAIHNTNLSYLITQLPVCEGVYRGLHKYYYDLYDINVLRTFRICFKKINYNISSYSWWINVLNTASNGIYFTNNYYSLNQRHATIYHETSNLILHFYNVISFLHSTRPCTFPCTCCSHS